MFSRTHRAPMFRRPVFLAAAVAFLFVPAVSLLSQQYGPVVFWEKRTPPNAYHDASYHHDRCAGFTRADRKGVVLFASDVYTGLHQTVIIEKDAAGRVRLRESRMLQSPLNPYEFTFPQTSIQQGYDIFFVECRAAARFLPPEVTELFFGYYGLP